MINSEGMQKCGLVLGFYLIIALFFPMDYAHPDTSALKKKFASLGIIMLAGTPPPASHGLFDMDGNPVTLSDFEGKIVFLNFWTTWCPSCVYEMPDIEKLHKKIDKDEFVILAIDLKESSKKVKKFIKKHKLTFNILMDEKGVMGRAFGIRNIPTTFILNRQGGLMGKAMGPRDWGGGKSIDLFEYLLKTE
ncbi:MAG: TlpA family protein disulfide reductase [Desulfobacula sp.]|nr:TlpA family protein disulfide reductase [Desulfobacula sp.]